MSLFDGSSGRTPAAEARRYVYGCIAASLVNSTELTEGWYSPGDEADEFDRRRLRKAIKAVYAEMCRKQKR